MFDSNNKTSLLVNDQLPAFVREEHDTFIKFMEYYYKSLEVDGQTLYVAKNFPRYLNIDIINQHILDAHNPGGEREYYDYHAFLQKMYDIYIKYIPDSILADKVTLVKHAKEFYRSSGTEKSVRFLIRALFDKEAEFYYPKTDILRTSDGKWFIEKSLKILDIKVDNTANDSAVNNFANTKIIGLSSNASAIVEKVDTYFDKGQIIYELKLSNISKEFVNNEGIFAYYTEEGVDKQITANLFSGQITAVQIIEGGTGYTEGTTVPIISGQGSGAQIVISKVSKGSIKAAGILKSGAGFKVDDTLVISGSGSGAYGYLVDVDDSGFYHPNSYNIVWSTINLESNTAIGNITYSNLNSLIVDPANDSAGFGNSMSYFVYGNCGPALSALITLGGQNYVPPVSITISANSIMSKLGILGKMQIVEGGTGYAIGDWIQFTNTFGSSGTGAIANVTNVAANGMITEVKFQQMPGHIVGGSGYDWDYLPAANIISATGVGANVAVTAVLGQNEELTQSISDIGIIEGLTIISGGTGYLDDPTLALDLFGDGTATAKLYSTTGVFSYPGRFINDDGKLSAYNFLEDRDYYQEFSYVVRVDESIENYRAALRDLTHPAGTKLFGEYTFIYDKETDTNTNVTVNFANTESYAQVYPTLYQVQGYTSGVFSPNVVTGRANAEFIVGSFSMNTSNHLSTYAAQNNAIVINYPSHSFLANGRVFLKFEGSNTNANVGNTTYAVTAANVDYITVYNPLNARSDGNSNTGIVRVFNPDVMVVVPYSRPTLNENVYLQFKTVDPALSNGFYQVTGIMSVNTFNVLHPDMTRANDAANVANLITKKITITANNHEFNTGDHAYILFLNGDTSNTRNGYYTVNDVGSANTFNIMGPNIIFAGSTTRTYQKRSSIVITNHPYANGNTAYIAFTSGDQGNTVNGVYTPIKTGTNTMTVNVAKPATGNSNVRVWYQSNNYSNIVFTTLRDTSGYVANTNVFVEFSASANDMPNGIYMVKSVYSSNTYNIYFDANTSIVNSTLTYGSLVFIPNTVNVLTGNTIQHTNTINSVAHSGLGIVANSRMEGIASVSLYK
jgi:hypothetical protein